MNLAVPVGIVEKDFIKNVEAYQEKKFTSIGKFDLLLLCDMMDLLSDETSGEVELLMMSSNKMKDGRTSGLLVAKYDGENYIALGGLAEFEGVAK